MKIYGIGVDIVNINRIQISLKRDNFLKRIFSKSEITYCNKRKNTFGCLAKRFAAKEAFSKALGLGIAKGVSFKEIVVQNDLLGKPSIKLTGKTKKTVNKVLKKKKFNIYLSLTDDKPFAVANVIISL